MSKSASEVIESELQKLLQPQALAKDTTTRIMEVLDLHGFRIIRHRIVRDEELRRYIDGSAGSNA